LKSCADLPGWRISREQVGERVSYVARGQCPGANPSIAEADAATRLRAMLEPPPLDASRPDIARLYDYWLGGKDNYAADRPKRNDSWPSIRTCRSSPAQQAVPSPSGGLAGRARQSAVSRHRLRAAHRAEHTPDRPSRVADVEEQAL